MSVPFSKATGFIQTPAVLEGGCIPKSTEWMKLPSTTQFGFGRAYQLVHDFLSLWFYWYPPFIEMLHKQFEVIGYKKVNCIKGTLGLASIIVKRRENSQNPSYAFTTLIITKMNDLGNSRCLAGSGAFPNSSCNKEPPCTCPYKCS